MSSRQLEIVEALRTSFTAVNEEQWQLLQSELVRHRAAIAAAVMNSQNRWKDWGARAEEIGKLLWEILGFAQQSDWFEQVSMFLDGTERPYLFVALDRKTPLQEVVPAGEANVVWRSTLSREALLDTLRGLMRMIESEPELVEGLEGQCP